MSGLAVHVRSLGGWRARTAAPVATQTNMWAGIPLCDTVTARDVLGRPLMGAVVTSLGTMAVIVAVGWLLARLKVLGDGAQLVVAKLVFMVATPSLLVSTIASSDLHLLLTRTALVTVLSTGAMALVAALALRLVLRRDGGETTIGALSASYLNAGNLGLPLSVYMLGNPVAVVPTLLFQLLVLAPVAFVLMESRGSGRGGRALLTGLGRSLRNPIIIAALAGVLLALLPPVPEWSLRPFQLVGAAAAPLALMMLGMALSGPQTGGARAPLPDLGLVVVLRTLVHPALAWALGAWLGLEGVALFGVVAMAALPTAQNVLVYAMRYGSGQAIARDSQLVTTVLAVPLLIAIALIFN